MPFQTFEDIKLKHPHLRVKLDALANYIVGELEEGRSRIVPALAAAHLKQSEAETLGLLMLLEDAGLIRHQYDIVCRKTNAVLATVSSKSELEHVIPVLCQLCDAEHGADDLRIELVFEVMPSVVPLFRQHAFA